MIKCMFSTPKKLKMTDIITFGYIAPEKLYKLENKYIGQINNLKTFIVQLVTFTTLNYRELNFIPSPYCDGDNT